jgi:hypothetical protein
MHGHISPSVRHQQRPLSTYTTLGSPLHRRSVAIGTNSSGRARSMSLGAAAAEDSVGGVGVPSPFHVDNPSIPHRSPAFHGIGNPQTSGMSGVWMIPNAPGTAATIVSPGAASALANSTMSLVPDPSEQRQAVEAVLAAERIRTKTCEEEESFLTADELRTILKRERTRASKLQGELTSLRYSSGRQQQRSEVLEEGRINGLMRRMDVLQEEKGRIMDELEREEMVRGRSMVPWCA